VGSILFFLEGEYCSRHDDDLMIFCCLIADLGCSKFPTRLKGEGTKKSCEFVLLLGEWGGTTQERERERTNLWVPLHLYTLDIAPCLESCFVEYYSVLYPFT